MFTGVWHNTARAMPSVVVAVVAACVSFAFCFDLVVADGATRTSCIKPATSRQRAPSSVERAPFGTFNTSGNWSYLVPRYPGDVKVTFIIFRKGHDPFQYRMGDDIQLLTKLKGNITVFTHDLPPAYSSEVNDLIDQLLRLEDKTVIHLRWNVADCAGKQHTLRDFYYCPEGPNHGADLYQQAAGDSRLVARQAARFLNSLLSARDSEDNLDNVHFIGFGIGAHVGALLAEELSFAGLQLGRLSALNPTQFLFEDTNLSRLSQDSARFVDVVHTSACLGMTKPLGHIDFYVNEGETQPGCSTKMCSHVRALTLYGTSIAKCSVLRRAVPKKVTPDNEGVSAIFGYWCFEDNVTGSFRVKTGHVYPYCPVSESSRHATVQGTSFNSSASSAAFVNYALTSVVFAFCVHPVHGLAAGGYR